MSFVSTGFHAPTFTTCDDPRLTVYENTSGIFWLIQFYVDDTLIDTINLEFVNIMEDVHPDVLLLPVTNEDIVSNCTVGDLIDDAKSVYAHSAYSSKEHLL